MYARDLISDAIPTLRTTDTVQRVLDRMAEFRVSHLPVVSNKEVLGLVAEEDLIEVPDYNAQVGSLDVNFRKYDIYEDQHVYDVIRLINEHHLTLVPVLDRQKNYLGLITLTTLTEYFATLTSIKEPGSIIVLEINNRDNSLAHVAQIVESENAQILSSYIKSYPDSTKLELTLKLNRTDVSGIVASFLRYDYTVKATFNDIKADEGNQDRYDQLMNYLDI